MTPPSEILNKLLHRHTLTFIYCLHSLYLFCRGIPALSTIGFIAFFISIWFAVFTLHSLLNMYLFFFLTKQSVPILFCYSQQVNSFFLFQYSLYLSCGLMWYHFNHHFCYYVIIFIIKKCYNFFIYHKWLCNFSIYTNF